MRYFWIFLLLPTPLFAVGNPYRTVDGQAQFAYGQVNGTLTWSKTEHDATVANFNLYAATSPVSIQVFIPVSADIVLSTNVPKGSDLGVTQTKSGLLPILTDLYPKYLLCTSPSFVGDPNCVQTIAQYNYLSKTYQTLP